MNINHIKKLFIFFFQYIECLKILLYVMQKAPLFNYIVLIFLQLMMIPLIGLLVFFCLTSVTTRHDAMTTKPTLNSSKINSDRTRQPSLEHIDIAEGLV